MAYPVIPTVPAANVAPYPAGAVPLVQSSGNKAATAGTAVLPASSSGQTTYITGFDVTGSGATAASVVAVTVSDGTWTATYELAVVAGATLQNDPLSVRFNPPLPASAPDTAITVSCPSLGAGSTNSCVNAFGYQL